MHTEVELVHEQLFNAKCPEDVFGLAKTGVHTNYRRLARSIHPDLNPEPLAKEAFQKLNDIKEIADTRIANGDWGKKLPLISLVEIGKYNVPAKPIVGDICDVYIGDDVVIKVARSLDDNDLLRAEVQAVQLLDSIPTMVKDGAPKLKESFKIGKRQANVIKSLDGFVTAEYVHSKTKVDARTAVWMFKRLLTFLSWVHHFKLVHGAILPPHVMFYPDNDGKGKDPRKHSIRLIDWCYSVDFTKRTRMSSWVPKWKDHYAPELLDKSYIGPESDIYMAAKLISYLCDDLPYELETVLKKCLDVDPKKRYAKAIHAFEAWQDAAKKEFGAPKWHEFSV